MHRLSCVICKRLYESPVIGDKTCDNCWEILTRLKWSSNPAALEFFRQLINRRIKEAQ